MKQKLFKKVVAFFVIAVMIMTSVPATFALKSSEFKDFPTGWSADAMQAAVDNGLLYGKSDGMLFPHDNLTRAEMATIINRAFGATIEADISSYKDVSSSAWYYHDIAKAVNAQTFEGDSTASMRPDAHITRQEVFAVIARVLVLETNDYSSLSRFNDGNKVSDWAKKYVSSLASKHYINGNENGGLCPLDYITREEFAQVMHNIIKTYYTESKNYTYSGDGSSVIRTRNVIIHDAVIQGDLILGDGVGTGDVTLQNVTIKGRLVCRGGEGKVKLLYSTVGEGVVIKDVNGTVNFLNYRTDAPFKNLREITPATFLKNIYIGSSGGGSSSGGSSSTVYVSYSTIHRYEQLDGTYTSEISYFDRIEKGTIVSPREILKEGYVLDTSRSDSTTETVGVYDGLEFNLYYVLKEYRVTIDGTEIIYKHGDNIAHKITLDANRQYYYMDNGNKVYVDGTEIIKGEHEIISEPKPISKVNVTFDENYVGGKTNSVEIAVGTKVAEPVDPEREHYTFVDWYTDIACTTVFDFDRGVTESVTLYAKWVLTNYSIKYNSKFAFKNPDSIIKSFTFETETITLPVQSDFNFDSGYSFGGWYTDIGYTKPITQIAKGTDKNIEIYARWISPTPEYDVVFDMNYVSGVNQIVSVKEGETVSQIANPSREHYTFDNWYTDKECTTRFNFATSISKGIVIYANWIPDIYTITYNSRFEFVNSDLIVTKYSVETNTISLPIASDFNYETGYTFGGWYTDSAYTNAIKKIVKGTYGDIQLYAKWIAPVPKYNFTFNMNYTGGTNTVFVVSRGNKVNKITDPSRNYYDFDNWYKDKACTVLFDFTTEINETTEIYAHWTPTVYSITYNSQFEFVDSDSIIKKFTIESDEIMLPQQSDFDFDAEYLFDGWYSDIGCTNSILKIAKGTYGDLQLYAKWNRKKYDVLFHKGSNPEAFDSVQVVSGSNLFNSSTSLDDIYEGYGLTLPKYKRSSLGYNRLDVEYAHQVNKEFIYEESPGVWSLFADNTKVDRDIDVYCATKYATIETNIPQISMPLVLDIRYDSNSRIIDSLKDTLLSAGLSFEQKAVKDEIESKTTKLYDKIYDETGMIDSKGNILDKDYGLKIIDVIDYDKIKAEIDLYIKNMLNGSDEDLRAVISLIDIDTLVDELGGKELINALGMDSLRSMLKEERVKDKVVSYMQDKIKTDSTIIDKVLDSSAKDKLIDKAASSNEFIVELIDNDEFKSEIINIIKTDETIQDNLISYLDKPSVRTEILNAIKEGDQLETLVDNLNSENDDFKKDMVEKIAYPDQPHADEIEKAIRNIIDTDDKYEDFRGVLSRYKNAYKGVVQYYVEGESDYIDFDDDKFEEYASIINEVIDKVIDDFFDYSKGVSTEKPVGYDTMNSYMDDALIDFVKTYFDGSETLDDEINEVIEENIITFIGDYFRGTSSLVDDEDIKNLADDIKGDFIEKVKDEVSEDTDKLKDPINDFVSDENNSSFVNDFVSENYIDILDAVDDEFIRSYIDSMSDDDVNSLVKDYAETDTILDYISEMSEDDRIELSKKIVSFLDSYKPFTDFMTSFENKSDYFEVNKDNLHFAEAVGKAVYGFEFDEILRILKSKGFGPMIDFLGDDIVSDIFDASKKDYWEGLEPVVDAVKADGITRKYTSKMNITINAPLIIHGIYDNYSAKFINKIEENGIYDYDKNTALKKLVNLDWFNLLVGYDPERIDETTGATGYYFRDYMDYYCLLLDSLILYDDALCFYNNIDYDNEKLILVKKGLTKEFISFLEELESLSDRIDNGQPIVGSYTLNDLIEKVDLLNEVANSMESSVIGSQSSNIEKAVNEIKSLLENLGYGDLPGGYTLEDLNSLCGKLKDVVNSMNEIEYTTVNAKLEEIIPKAMKKLNSVITELDENGTVAGKNIESIISRISVLNTIYNNYTSQIKDIISTIADVQIDFSDIKIDSEKYEEIIFGREEDIFNIDSLIELIKDKLNKNPTGGYNATKKIYIIDQYSKNINNNEAIFQRIFY